MRIIVLLLALLMPAAALPPSALASSAPASSEPAFSALAAATDAEGFAWQQHPGVQIPIGAALRDEAGRPVTLAGAIGQTPAILDLGYFHCPSLCGVTRADLFAALKAGGLLPGRDVSVVAISIDPAETPVDSASAEAADLAALPAAWRAGVHYLTASPAGITGLERSAGFHARWDARFKQFMHPAGVVVLTRTGRISSYLLGVGYAAGDVRAAVLRAGDGGIAQAALPILLLCFHFDSTTGRYTLAIVKLLRLLGGLTVVTIGGLFWALKRKESKRGIV